MHYWLHRFEVKTDKDELEEAKRRIGEQGKPHSQDLGFTGLGQMPLSLNHTGQKPSLFDDMVL